MIAIIDYGMGNLRSAQKGFEAVGHDAILTDDPKILEDADGVVLPGVGAFRDCFEGLADRGLVEPVRTAAASGKPFLGICVGLQLLFEGSEEGDASEGLGIFPGTIVRFPAAESTGLKVPHMGWNQLEPQQETPLLAGCSTAPYVYFVHSYYAQPSDPGLVLASCTYGVSFPAMLGRGNVFAVQFHPEKSQREGLAILKAFGDMTLEGT